MTRPWPGFFLTLEGVEGSGKSTACRALAEHFSTQGHEVVVTREPGGCPLAERIRDLFLHEEKRMHPLTELCLILAARAEHWSTVIYPALQAGKVVLCDRFHDSTAAYQGAGRGVGVEEVFAYSLRVTAGQVPDLTLFFDFDVEEGLRRAREVSTRHDRLEAEETQFHQRVAKGFQELLKKHPGRIVRIDASQPREEVEREVLARCQAITV